MRKKAYLVFLSILVIILCFMGKDVYASEYLSDKTETMYNVSNGLLTGKANTICQTDDGYIWIGQYAGLTRYDSKTFNTMTSYGDCNLTSIVTLASKGNILFIGSEKGFYVKDEKGVIKRIVTDDLNLVVTDIKVIDDYAYVGSKSGLYQYTISTGIIKRIKDGNITRIAIKDKDNFYYLVGKENVYSNKSESEVVRANIKSIYYYDEKLYVGTRSGSIIIVDLNTLDQSIYQLNGLSSTINDILIHKGMIYLSADAGLFIGSIIDFNISEVKSYNDDYNRMEKAFFDYEDNLWLASSSLGVCKITQNDIIDLFFEFDLKNETTYAVEKYNSLTFIGTGNGLYIVDERTGKVYEEESIYYPDSDNESYHLYQLCNMIGNRPVRDIEIYQGKIYFAIQNANGALFSYNANDLENPIEILNYDDMSNNNYLESEAKDFRCLRAIDNYLFIGLDKGISRYDGNSFSFKPTSVYPLYFTYNDGVLYTVLNTIGVVYCSASDFINSHLERIDSINRYSTLKCYYINGGILFTDNNDLYFCKNNEIKKLDYNFIGSIVDIVYVNDIVYIATEASIYIIDDLFNSDKNSYKTLDSTNGLKSSLVANSSGYYDKDTNTYYFSSSTGVLKYTLDNEYNNKAKVSRKICIGSILVDGENVLKDKVELGRRDKNLVINFSVLSYSSDQHYKVYYRLKGYEKEFQTLNPNDSFSINYKNIKGGNYKFELYTIDEDGTRSFNVIELNLTKEKSLFEHVWFLVLLCLLDIIPIIIISVIIYKIKIRRTIRRQNEYKKITIESIEAIARTIDAKDKYTNGHSIRVGIYSREIAKALNLSKEEVENIYYIALLHDIGKISISLKILNKPGKLTDEEYEIMKTHTTSGGKILEGISTIPHIVEGAMYHHEKYDGTGYPKGLKEEEIPFIARIICCADCYDAMGTRRPYKEPYSKEQMIEEFEKGKSTQFDPLIADVVIKLIKEDKLSEDYINNK